MLHFEHRIHMHDVALDHVGLKFDSFDPEFDPNWPTPVDVYDGCIDGCIARCLNDVVDRDQVIERWAEAGFAIDCT